MYSSSTAGDPVPADGFEEDDRYEIRYEEIEEEIEVEEEIDVEEDDDDDEQDHNHTQIDHHKDTDQVTEPDSHKEHSGTCSVMQGSLVSYLKAESDDGESGAKECGTNVGETSAKEYGTNVGETSAKDCGTDGLYEVEQTDEAQLDGKVMTGDLDCVPSIVDNKGNNECGGVFNGEMHVPIGNTDGSNKGAADNPGCEKESNLIASGNSIIGAPRVRQKSSTPSAENGNVDKRQAIICDFFSKGWCIKGNSCRFLHVRGSVSGAAANQHGGEDIAQKRMDLVDDEASSVAENHQPKDVENAKEKGDLELSLQNSSSMDLGSDCGRELPKDDPTPVFHGMYSCSPSFPDAHTSTEFFGHLRSDLRMGEGMAHHQNALGSLSSSYKRPLPSEFSSSNMVALGSSPFPGYESENLYGFSNTNMISGSRINIPYDWIPSAPFSPSSYITQNLLSAVRQKKQLAIEQSSAPWFSKCSYSDHEASIPEATHANSDPALEPDHFSNKYANTEPKSLAEKDESMIDAEALKTTASHRRNKKSHLKKDKLQNPTCAKNLQEAEGDIPGSNHERGMTSDGPRYLTVEMVGEEVGRWSKKNIEADGDAKVNGYHKESKVFKYFHVALVEFIKEILKPIWHEGCLSKDAHKTIVKKIVDKVVVALQPHQIPDTTESVKHYLSLSRPKLAKLVEGYANKYRNLEMAA